MQGNDQLLRPDLTESLRIINCFDYFSKGRAGRYTEILDCTVFEGMLKLCSMFSD